MSNEKKLLTWRSASYGGHVGSAGGIDLFAVYWRTRSTDPVYSMRSHLPGASRTWKNDSLDVLKGIAEKMLAAWIARVTGAGRQEETVLEDVRARVTIEPRISRTSSEIIDIRIPAGLSGGEREQAITDACADYVNEIVPWGGEEAGPDEQ